MANPCRVARSPHSHRDRDVSAGDCCQIDDLLLTKKLLCAFPVARKFGHSGLLDVRFGSLADICSAIAHVRFTPKSGHVRSFRSGRGLLAGPAIQNNNPDHGCDHQRATESRCQCPVIYCRDLHVCRLGGAANAICEVGHKATANFADPRRGSE
jgi:hypothetical protein